MYDKLADAIIGQACSDYVKALKKISNGTLDKSVYDEKRRLEAFFKSDWFDVLAGGLYNGEKLMNHIVFKVNVNSKKLSA